MNVMVTSLVEIERLAPGFSDAVAAFDRLYFVELEEYEPFSVWFEENDRRAIVSQGGPNVTVTVYEGTGQYVDEWRLRPLLGWIHVESPGTLVYNPKTHVIRELSEDELEREEL